MAEFPRVAKYRCGWFRIPWAGLVFLFAVLLFPNVQAQGGEVHVVSNRWHTGIALARQAIDPEILPEIADLPEPVFVEFGWGDKEFYQTPDPGLATTLIAAMTPTPAVMHVAGLAAAPALYFTDVEVVVLDLPPDDFRHLQEQIAASFARPGARLGRSLYGRGYFYPAVGEFHLFNTCNSWTARMLAAAGVAIDASSVQSAEDVMRQLRSPPDGDGDR